MDNNNKQPPKKPEGKKPKIWVMLIATAAIVLAISSVYNAVKNSQYTQTKFTDFMAEVDAGNIAEVEIHQDRIFYLTKTEAAKPAHQQKTCYTGLPSGNILELAQRLNTDDTEVDVHIVEDNSTIMMILYYLIMFGVLFGFMMLLSKKMGGGMMGGMGGRRGGGMFSIAPNKTHKEAVRTVCLEHGKKEPRSTVKYTIVPIDSYTDNKTTQVLCEMLGDKELDQNAVQVAVWSAENGMTMEELAAKTRQTSRNNPVESYFKPGELQLGAELLAQANGRAKVVEEVEKAKADLENYKPEKTDDTIERLTEQVLSE